MIKSRWPSLLLALILLIASSAIIVYVSFLDRDILLSSNVTLVIALFGLSLTTFAVLTLLLREIAFRLRKESIHFARQQALAEHRRFLRRLDHELKNPITALRAGLGSLLLTAEPGQIGIFKTLDDEVRRLNRLVADLRKLADLEVETLEVHSIVLPDFIEEIIDLDKDRILSQGRRFNLENKLPENKSARLMGDQSLLQLAVHNLLDNALKYTEIGDTISLQIGIDEGVLTICVEDTGCGIVPDDLELVWEELYRGENINHVPGYGIGLALVRSIIERHNGEVAIKSQVNTGTKVYLYLPLL